LKDVSYTKLGGISYRFMWTIIFITKRRFQSIFWVFSKY